MVALAEENWIRQGQIEIEGYTMLGFPAERTSERITGFSTAHIEATMFTVRRLELDQDHRKTFYPRFVGQLDYNLPPRQLERQTRTVYGCSLPVLGSLMTHWARENIAILRELDSNSAEICLSAPNAAIRIEHFIRNT